MIEISISLGIIILALSVMLFAGRHVVRTMSAMARFLRFSEYVLSFILIAFATSLPELSVGVNAALLDVSEVSFGDILGTNIVNVTLILGVVAVIGGGIGLKDYTHFSHNRIFLLLAVLSPLLLMLDGTLSRTDGLILLALFVWNIIRLFDIDDAILGRKVLRPHLVTSVHTRITSRREFLKYFAVFLVSMAALLLSTLAVVMSVQKLSVAVGISGALIGVLVIAICTSLPDFFIGLRSVRKKLGGMALGDVFGAASINSTMTLGIVALISPITLESAEVLWAGIVFTVLAFLTVFIFLRSKQTISRSEGVVLVGLYVAFVATQIGLFIF